MPEAPIIISEPANSRDNEVRPFAIEGMDVKGRAVRLGTVVDHILSAHDYPDFINHILGEMLALAAMLGSLLKYEGIVTVQTKSDGPVPMMVVDYEAKHQGMIGRMRGCVTIDDNKMQQYGKNPSFKGLIGSKKGYLALTIDQGADMERYQGIVDLAGETLSDVARNYFNTSEQTPTEIQLTCDRDSVSGHWRAGGIMVQHLAHGEEGKIRLATREEENWTRASVLVKSVKTSELTDPSLDLDQLLYRLYNEDGVRVFDAAHMQKGCRCSRVKIHSVISQFKAEELEDMLEDGLIKVNCQFCNSTYNFTIKEAIERFANQ